MIPDPYDDDTFTAFAQIQDIHTLYNEIRDLREAFLEGWDLMSPSRRSGHEDWCDKYQDLWERYRPRREEESA
ncbi:MAG TPA: hypothetical protein VEI97_05265 [bacterium]|nr:hypothetical protein [bacterium]